MRVFLSAYPGFTLAIPMDAVASMILYNQKTEKTVQYDPKNRSTYISLPWMFNMPDQAVPHGVVLREWNTKENKVVLLTAEVKRDIEIPDKEFHPLPKALSTMRFSEVFSGIKFSDNPILLLNVEQLLQVVQNEMQATDEKPKPPPKQPLPTMPSEPLPPAPDKVIEKPPIEKPPVKEPLVEEPRVEEPPVEEPPVEEPPIEEPPVEEPPTSPVETSEPSPSTANEAIEVSLTLEPQTSPQGEVSPLEPQTSPEGEVSPLDEVLEICEVIEEPTTSSAVAVEASDSSPLTLDEVLEICEVTEEPPTSPAVPAEISEPSPPAPEPQPSPQVEVSPLVEIIEICEADEFIEVCEDIEFCEIIDESPTISVEISDPSPSTLNEIIEVCEVIDEPPTIPQGEISPIDEILELCDV